MKIYQGLAALFLAMALSTGIGFAQEEEGEVAQAQTGLTTAETKAINSQGNPKNRANQAMKIANQKMKEARKNAQNGDAAGTANAVRGYETALGHAMSSLQEGEGQGVDMTNTINKVTEGTLKHQTTLAEVHDRVPDQAKPHILHAMEVSALGHENSLTALENVAARQSSSQRQGRTFLNVAGGRVEQAQAAAARGDEASAQRAGEGYARALNGSMRAISTSRLQGAELESALSRVTNATEKHQATLQDVMGRVPEQAQEAIQKAMAASQKGHESASANLQRMRQRRMARQQQASTQGGGRSGGGGGRGGGGAGRGGGASGGAPGRR